MTTSVAFSPTSRLQTNATIWDVHIHLVLLRGINECEQFGVKGRRDDLYAFRNFAQSHQIKTHSIDRSIAELEQAQEKISHQISVKLKAVLDSLLESNFGLAQVSER